MTEQSNEIDTLIYAEIGHLKAMNMGLTKAVYGLLEAISAIDPEPTPVIALAVSNAEKALTYTKQLTVE